MTETLNALRPKIGMVLKYSLLCISLLILGAHLWDKQLLADIRFGAIGGVFGEANIINTFFNLYWLPNNLEALFGSQFFLFSTPVLGACFYLIINPLLSHFAGLKLKLKWSQGIVFVLMFGLIGLVFHYFNFFFTLISIPFLFTLSAAFLLKESPAHLVPRAFKYGVFRFNNWMALGVASLVTLLVAYLLHSPLFWTLSYVIQLFYIKEDLAYADLIRGILLFMSYASVFVFFILYYLNVAANYVYNRETDTHDEIKQAIDSMQANKQILGFEVE